VCSQDEPRAYIFRGSKLILAAAIGSVGRKRKSDATQPLTFANELYWPVSDGLAVAVAMHRTVKLR